MSHRAPCRHRMYRGISREPFWLLPPLDLGTCRILFIFVDVYSKIEVTTVLQWPVWSGLTIGIMDGLQNNWIGKLFFDSGVACWYPCRTLLILLTFITEIKATKVLQLVRVVWTHDGFDNSNVLSIQEWRTVTKDYFAC